MQRNMKVRPSGIELLKLEAKGSTGSTSGCIQAPGLSSALHDYTLGRSSLPLTAVGFWNELPPRSLPPSPPPRLVQCARGVVQHQQVSVAAAGRVAAARERNLDSRGTGRMGRGRGEWSWVAPRPGCAVGIVAVPLPVRCVIHRVYGLCAGLPGLCWSCSTTYAAIAATARKPSPVVVIQSRAHAVPMPATLRIDG